MEPPSRCLQPQPLVTREGLAERMRMPGGPGAGFKRHQGHTDAGGLGVDC